MMSVATLCAFLESFSDLYTHLTSLTCSVDLGDQNSLSTTYTVALAAGTQVVLSLEDAAGNEAWSDTVSE